MRITKSVMAALMAGGLLLTAPFAANAASCGNTSAGFENWVREFKQEAQGQGISPSVLDRAFADIHYNQPTIRADRGQKSFKLSFEEFLQKRGASSIIAQAKSKKAANRALLARIEQRYGVPPGMVLAIWGMETGFGGFTGNQPTLSALATLAYDCRRSAMFTEQLYAALKLVSEGYLSPSARGAAHGEIGQTQFMPKNVVLYGVDADGDGKVDLIGSRADALASAANLLKGHGWRPGAGYQPGEPNFAAIGGWNDSSVYQQALAYMAKRIDGE